jgi:hypothetical protein
MSTQSQGFDDQKLKKFTAETNSYFFDQNLQFTYPWASTKDVQATEVFIPQKRTYNNSELEFSSLLLLCKSFWPSWIQIRIPNADPDPAEQNECGCGSTTRVTAYVLGSPWL